jgi:hypothetical protein
MSKKPDSWDQELERVLKWLAIYVSVWILVSCLCWFVPLAKLWEIRGLAALAAMAEAWNKGNLAGWLVLMYSIVIGALVAGYFMLLLGSFDKGGDDDKHLRGPQLAKAVK